MMIKSKEGVAHGTNGIHGLRNTYKITARKPGGTRSVRRHR
jgi:hypothetical protein